MLLLHMNALPPPQYPVIESLFEREAKRVVYVDGRVHMRAQEKKEKDEKEASHKQQVSYVRTYIRTHSTTTLVRTWVLNPPSLL